MNSHRVEYWYDNRSRNWIIQLLSAEGYQIGDADYAGHPDHALHSAVYMAVDNMLSVGRIFKVNRAGDKTRDQPGMHTRIQLANEIAAKKVAA